MLVHAHICSVCIYMFEKDRYIPFFSIADATVLFLSVFKWLFAKHTQCVHVCIHFVVCSLTPILNHFSSRYPLLQDARQARPSSFSSWV